MVPSREFVPLAMVANKWRHPEGDLLDWALQKKFYLYYFLHLPTGSGWRVIQKELGCFLRGDDSVSCSDFSAPVRMPIRPMNPMVPFTANHHLPAGFNPIGPKDPIDPIISNDQLPTKLYLYPIPLADISNFCFPPLPSVTVRKSDLFLHHDEIADMEARYPELAKDESEIETNPKLEEPKIAREADTRIETSNIPIIDEPVDILLRQNDSESVSPSCADAETVATLDSRPPLSQEIDKKSDSIAQAENPDGIKNPHKKKVKASQRLIGGDAEPLLLSKDDREPLPFKTFADLHTRTLSLDDIIGNREKGIPAIIPVSKSTWYAGVKSGRYPKPFEVSEGRVAWKGSDIYTLLQKMGLV